MDIFFDELRFFIQIIVLLLIYQNITGTKISPKLFFFTPLFLRVLFLISAPMAYGATLSFLVIYSLYKNNYRNRFLDVFYGLYPIIIESLFTRLFYFIILPLIGISIEEALGNIALKVIVEIIALPTYYGLVHILKVDFKNLQEGFEKKYLNYFLILVDISMIIYFFLLQFLLIFDSYLYSPNPLYKYLIGSYTILLLIMLVYMNGTFKERLEEEIIAQKNQQLADLANYSKQIEILYKEIKNFRHDYINILSSIKIGIDKRDIDAVAEIYQNVLSETGKYFQSDRYDLMNLINIKNETIKSVLSAKILEAQNKGIAVKVEVAQAFDSSKMDLLDFIRILSIFFDNAIEGAVESPQPQIVLALISDSEQEVVIIENSIKSEKVEIGNIFSYGYSSKGEQRGIGLSNAIELINKYSQVTLETRTDNYRFKHILQMK